MLERKRGTKSHRVQGLGCIRGSGEQNVCKVEFSQTCYIPPNAAGRPRNDKKKMNR